MTCSWDSLVPLAQRPFIAQYQIEEQRDKVKLKMQAGAIATPVQPAPKQSKPPPSPAEEPAKKKSGGVVKKPPAKPADAGDGGEGDPEPPLAEPVKKCTSM